MRWIRYVKVALLNSFGALVGILWLPISDSVAQSLPASLELEINSPQLEYPPSETTDFGEQSTSFWETVQFMPGENSATIASKAKSLAELYQMGDRLKTELNEVFKKPAASEAIEPWKYQLQLKQYEHLLKNLRAVEAKILVEQKAAENWERATDLAKIAVEKGKNPYPTTSTWTEAEDFWREAIQALRQIPQESLLADSAIEKTIEYQGYLAIATYEKLMAPKTRPENLTTASASVSLPVQKLYPGFTMYGDTNRDGWLNDRDKSRKRQWSLSQGPLMLFNNDDDDEDRAPDWQDRRVNGKDDEKDLAIVNLEIAEDYAGSQIYIVADTNAGDYINVFEKTKTGWRLVDISGNRPLASAPKLVLGVEAKQFADRNWTGIVSLTAIAKKDGQEIASDAILMGVVPWILSPNTAPVSEIHVSDRDFYNQEFISQIQQIVEKTGATAKIIPGATPWMQDTTEIGYVQFPAGGTINNYNVALKGNLEGENDDYARSLLNPDFGWFEIGESRKLDPLNQWSDGLGNLAVTPPLPRYPMGRVYYGNSGDASLNPEIIEFIEAQKIQGPPVDIDTSWLLIRHVDEIVGFLPTASGKPLMAIASTEAGISMLQNLQELGYGQAAINRGLSTQTTVRAALGNQQFIQHNLDLQRDKLNPLLEKLKREFQLEDDQIILVPALFGYSGYSWLPNMLNSVVVNGELLVSNPRGPIINGRDYIQEEFRRLVAISDLNVRFIEDSYYQELGGNSGDATNTTREGEDDPFWYSLPANLR